MDRLQSMTVFRRVVERAGFAAAARDLGLSNAGVSKHVAALEEHLETRLLHRTTRRVSPTTAGAAYYERCVAILDAIDEAEQSVGRAAAEPTGVLRVNVPLSFGVLHVSPLLPELLAAHPQLRLDVSFEDRFVDLVEERLDVAVRVATELADSTSLTAHRLARAGHVLCAAPSYLARRGAPRGPDDLAGHDAVLYGLSRRRGEWALDGPRGPSRIPIEARLVLGSSLAVRDAVIAGAGIALMPSFYVVDELSAGRLARVLPDHEGPRVTVSAVHAKARHAAPKIRAFIELLKRRFARAPWAIGAGAGGRGAARSW